MSKTLPASMPLIDPDRLRAGQPAVEGNHYKDLIEGQNWIFSKLRHAAGILDFRFNDRGDGIFQGAGSGIDTTADGSTWVPRIIGYYRSRAVPDNNDLLTLVTYAECDSAADSSVRARFLTTGGSLTETITATHTANTTAVQTVKAASSALDGDTLYRVIIDIQAGSSSFLKLYRLAVYEDSIAIGAMP